jgi:hypothetical protein
MLIVQKTDTPVATPEQLALVAEYDSLRRMRDDLDAEIKKVQDAMVASLGEVNKVTKPNGKPAITLSPVTTSGKFDRARLKEERPDIHDLYWTPGGTITGTRLTVTP